MSHSAQNISFFNPFKNLRGVRSARFAVLLNHHSVMWCVANLPPVVVFAICLNVAASSQRWQHWLGLLPGVQYVKQLICLSGYSYYPQRHIQTNFSVQKFERAVVVNDRKSHQRAQVFALSRPCVRHFSLSSWFPMTESMPRTFTAYRVAVGMGKVGTKPCGLFTAYPLGYVLQKNVKSKSKLLLCTVLLPPTYSPRCCCPYGFRSQRRWLPRFQTLCLSSRSVFVVCMVELLHK